MEDIIRKAEEIEAMASSPETLGDAVRLSGELLAGADPVCVECVAVRDRFGKSGEFEELLGYFNIDATAIVEAVKKVRERAGLC